MGASIFFSTVAQKYNRHASVIALPPWTTAQQIDENLTAGKKDIRYSINYSRLNGRCVISLHGPMERKVQEGVLAKTLA